MQAKESLESSFPANSVAQQCLDVVMQHAASLPRPSLEEMTCHYQPTGKHAARNAHPPPNIEIISASELVDIAGGADAFRKIWKCEHPDVLKFIDAKAQMRSARGEAIIAQKDLQWHRAEASESSVLSAQVAAASQTTAVSGPWGRATSANRMTTAASPGSGEGKQQLRWSNKPQRPKADKADEPNSPGPVHYTHLTTPQILRVSQLSVRGTSN